MVCAKNQILTDMANDDEIEIDVSDDGQAVVISGDDFELTLCHEDFIEFIGACMSADAYMNRVLKERAH